MSAIEKLLPLGWLYLIDGSVLTIKHICQPQNKTIGTFIYDMKEPIIIMGRCGGCGAVVDNDFKSWIKYQIALYKLRL